MKKLSLIYVLLMSLMVVAMPMVIVKSFTANYQTRNISNEHRDPQKNESVSKEQKYINVYFHNEKKYVKMLLVEYVKGVVAGEMPASFNIEAIKAQAVAARTYTYARMGKNYKPRDNTHLDSPICDDPSHCQAYVPKESVIRNAGMVAGLQKWRKLETAVNSTRGMMIYYNGYAANPLFHSSSGGMTEDAGVVWGGKSVSYLMPVKSPGEEDAPGFRTTVEMSKQAFIDKLKAYKAVPAISSISKTFSLVKTIHIEKRSVSNRVMKLLIGKAEYTGSEIRTALGLRSTNFSFTEEADKIIITTLGFGHGVGMSQYGADAMARGGAEYIEILKHYYLGVEIKKVY